jgi:hypothetical protein
VEKSGQFGFKLNRSEVFAWYAHLRWGSRTVKVGDAVKAGAPIAKLGSSGPTERPHLHFGQL